MKPAVYNGTAEISKWLAGAPAPHLGRYKFYIAVLSLVLGLDAVVLAANGRSGVESDEIKQGVRAQISSVIVGPKEEPFNMPTDAAVGRNCDLYVLDGVHNRVVVYDAEGNYKFQFGGSGSGIGQFQFPLGITTGPVGKVYIADSGNHRFQVFSADGTPLEAVNLPDDTSNEPPDPADIAVDPNRMRLYVTDNNNHKLHVYNISNHSFEEVWGGPGQGQRQFRFPFLLDTTSRGYVLVVEPINTRVQVLNPNGKFVGFIGAWGIKPGQLFRPKGVAVWGDTVFVTDSYLGQIQVFEFSGNFLGMLSDTNGTPIQFTTPTGITIDIKHRRLYVVELKANRVRRVDLE